MTIFLQILSTIAILCFIGFSIWGMVVFHQVYNQTKYRNYLLEKLNQTLAQKNLKIISSDENEEEEVALSTDSENHEENAEEVL